jgi:very-long-chain ceramide synthase
MTEMWTEWPNRELTKLAKWYYLGQYAFCLQQILVVNIEERRKDYYHMLTHHIITCSLLFGSYAYHVTRVGTAILCVTDVADILLPVSYASHKYIHRSTTYDASFSRRPNCSKTYITERHAMQPLFFFWLHG